MDELNKIPIFALEGSAFVGKTTLLNYIKDNYGDKVNVIPEVGEYVGGDKYYPNITFKNFNEAKYSTHFFESIERCRFKDILKQYQQNGKPILIDRFTFLSSLVFYNLLVKNNIHSNKLGQKILSHAKSVFSENINKMLISFPKAFILVKHKNKKVFDSRLSRGTKNSVFTSWENCQYVNGLYDNYFENLPANSVLELDSTNSNLKQNAVKILSFIDKNIKNDKQLQIDDLLKSDIEELTSSDKEITNRANKYAISLIKQNLEKYGKI